MGEEEGGRVLKDFRPVSLVSSIYKFLVDVLVNRPKKVAGKVVSCS